MADNKKEKKEWFAAKRYWSSETSVAIPDYLPPKGTIPVRAPNPYARNLALSSNSGYSSTTKRPDSLPKPSAPPMLDTNESSSCDYDPPNGPIRRPLSKGSAYTVGWRPYPEYSHFREYVRNDQRAPRLDKPEADIAYETQFNGRPEYPKDVHKDNRPQRAQHPNKPEAKTAYKSPYPPVPALSYNDEGHDLYPNLRSSTQQNITDHSNSAAEGLLDSQGTNDMRANNSTTHHTPDYSHIPTGILRNQSYKTMTSSELVAVAADAVAMIPASLPVGRSVSSQSTPPPNQFMSTRDTEMAAGVGSMTLNIFGSDRESYIGASDVSGDATVSKFHAGNTSQAQPNPIGTALNPFIIDVLGPNSTPDTTPNITEASSEQSVAPEHRPALVPARRPAPGTPEPRREIAAIHDEEVLTLTFNTNGRERLACIDGDVLCHLPVLCGRLGEAVVELKKKKDIPAAPLLYVDPTTMLLVVSWITSSKIEFMDGQPVHLLQVSKLWTAAQIFSIDDLKLKAERLVVTMCNHQSPRPSYEEIKRLCCHAYELPVDTSLQRLAIKQMAISVNSNNYNRWMKDLPPRLQDDFTRELVRAKASHRRRMAKDLAAEYGL